MVSCRNLWKYFERGQIVEGLVWLSVKTHVSGAAFTVAAFIFAAVFAMATGSGFGTISTMSFILYPAGILLGANPAVLAGAILSGAAVGDNIAPVSDYSNYRLLPDQE